MNLNKILYDYFGHEQFRDKQKEVIENLLENKNTLCLMPTGLGKSIIFHVAGITSGKITIIFSPLLALMGQQVRNLNKSNVDAFAYNSITGDSKKQITGLMDFFKNKTGPRFLYVSPEKAFYDGFLEYLMSKYKNEIGLIVVDEAHCISQWGYNFRPAYKFIPQILDNSLGEDHKIPVLCLTATISKADAEEICNDFRIQKENIISSDSLIRDNITLNIVDKLSSDHDKKEVLDQILSQNEDSKAIVYVHIKKRDYGTRKMTEEFINRGYSCRAFDADFDDNTKADILQDFIDGKIRVIFATSAFGMGIDISDIRLIIHYLIPESIEQYYQEIGRSGRDFKPSFGYLLYTDTNFKIREDLIKGDKFTLNQVKEIFDKRINIRKSANPTQEIFNFSISDASEDVYSFIVFLHLLKSGHIKILSKGFGKLDAFEMQGHNEEWGKLSQASATKSSVMISKRLGISITSVHNSIHKWLFENQVKIVRSPEKVINYQIVQMPDDEVFNNIVNQNNVRIDKRLENFEKLKEMIENHSNDPVTFIENHIYKS